MTFDILTLFPGAFSYFQESILGRAQKKKTIRIRLHNFRDWARDRHRTVDGRPYGGGVGMVLKPDVMWRALDALEALPRRLRARGKHPNNTKQKTILLTPQGKVFTQRMAESLSKFDRLVLICGHYEGFDERIRKMVDMEVSLGDFVVSGGEPAAMVLVDAVARLLPGVLGKAESASSESFGAFVVVGGRKTNRRRLLEYPQYTRPEIFSPNKKFRWRVPKVLLSGDHKAIAAWRSSQALHRTRIRRPELIR
jgi:tRNA (guanine37-N1)-methyltransferase